MWHGICSIEARMIRSCRFQSHPKGAAIRPVTTAAALLAAFLCLAGCSSAPVTASRPAPITCSEPAPAPADVSAPEAGILEPDAASFRSGKVMTVKAPPRVYDPFANGANIAATAAEIPPRDEPEAGPVGAEASPSPVRPAVDPSRRTVALPPVYTDPRPAGAVPIEYPETARRRGQAGVVEIEVTLDEAGKVTCIRVAKTSGSPLLDDAARRALARTRFEPARRNGSPIPSTFCQAVRFVLQDKP
jgi:protein TonB